MTVSRKRCIVGLAAAAASASALLATAAPAGAATPGAAPGGIQVEAVDSATPVTVSDLVSAHPESVASTLYCAVRDNTFGCQQGTPGDGLVVSILYYDANFTGSQVVIFNPAYQVGCTSGTSDNEGGANLGTAANQISSARTYHSCDVKLFDGNNATGTATGWLNAPGSLGSMNDRANSFKIS
ncbi:hypothetical protein MUY14_19810 [Amycolatopsis sp. FBCC-B4732]|uniref:hypothetical protein n=1 Tax=Amycolatopsis sp. FBCC-B4732 TaxID=3079339 RepID=UPI001FF3E062|nr:hypothetical protein [Amycolatopsis sp. FBCC-B4732]UOX92757.1 hypothetical protein MUY14_19810 [Amycolatopsis sp. FBCC-B4732]